MSRRKVEKLKIKTRTIGEFEVYDLSGEFTVKSIAPFRDLFLNVFQKEKFFIAVNLSGIVLLDSSAIGLLINIHKKTSEKNGQLAIFALAQKLQFHFERAGVLELLAMFETEQEFRDEFVF